MAERELRAAGRRLVQAVEAERSRWATKASAAAWAAASDVWSDVVGLLSRVDDVVAALERAGAEDAARPPPAPRHRDKGPPAPCELVSLAELSAVHGALELVALWGACGVVEKGLRSIGQGRETSRAARVPIPAAKREPAGPTDKKKRLEAMFGVLFRTIERPALTPVSARFVGDALATALELDRFDGAGRARKLVTRVPGAVAARAVRELLGGAVIPGEEKVARPPTWSSKACGGLLATIARENLASIMQEFAGEDEVKGSGSDAPAVERNLATALASVDPEDDVGYARDVSPQLAFEIARGDDDSNSARGRIATLALARLATRNPDVVVAACAGSLFSWSPPGDQRRLEADRAIFSAIAAKAEFAGPFLVHPRVLASLLGLAHFCASSSRSADLESIGACLASLARSDSARFADVFDATAFAKDREERPRFGPGGEGGVELRGTAVERDPIGTTVAPILAATREPAAVGALFARLLRAHFSGDVDPERLAVLVKVAELLDAGAIETSGTAVLETLGVVLDARAEAAAREARLVIVREKDDDDDFVLEQVALGSLLAILELGAPERCEADEKALRALLPALEALSAPGRAETAGLASECRALVLTRGAARLRRQDTTTAKPSTWLEALDAARSDLAQHGSPALRACGVVSLTKFARAATRRREKNTRDVALPRPDEWQPLAAALVEALADDESYVFLAAAHSLAALADANPKAVVPFLCDAHETGKVGDARLGEPAIARLGEALACTIKRRGDAAPSYAPKLARALVRGARPDAPDPSPRARCARFSNLAELAHLARHAVAPFAEDLLDLITMTLDLEEKDGRESDRGFSTRRAAAFLARKLLSGSGSQCIDAAPRPTARMCRRLKALVDDDADDQNARHHAAFALEALETVLDAKIKGPDKNKKITARDVLPLARDDWLVSGGGGGLSIHDASVQDILRKTDPRSS
ncbi:hypothetical protein CTAYLR_008334 [Chrysophaeum taylorii]|uniref:RNA polymerase II assembly factor Rtp1 C-terminal domain-containing protein n=1 Tax=Chrysophaeum taylorii TaxID=2483200 RepID=A0AAD7UE61_9STRA|nr:hypothetical protein CTAYLR_008334 [Chrysophaeum taylorii]